MNQGTTEVMLALSLADSMVGTAYLDDEIWHEIEEDYKKVPVLSDSYPDIDTLMGTEPDFIYGSYRSAFQASIDEEDGRIGYLDILGSCNMTISTPEKNSTYCRAELNDANMQTYLQAPYCEYAIHRPDEVTLANLYEEIWDIALIFDVFENAQGLVSNIENHFQQATQIVEAQGSSAEPISVLWLDGWSDETPFIGACCGSVNTIIEYSGAKNIFADKGIEEKKSWMDAPWSEIVEKDPDVIVLVDAYWDLADEKIYNLCKNEKTRALRAVQTRRFITVPFSASTMGVRIGSLAYNLAEAIVALANGEALSSVDFTETIITNDGNAGKQALGSSGARVYTRLPVWNGTDLEEFCPGGMSSNIYIKYS
eukprot:CAMPEP_0113301502 /NCGR_PEP_ID=MMETSP0010_2-20120614/2709_1 /TAXON_ID=216773 ORGANISM="Corethron hystrix, Strain 308" /NCGR_SAMPLE_ID=MMETSP0010_2 /ASSEMBLY_ACC=CAM_ASM_000155 /LENGTH=367 /DNA_ID=CAMNT_0000155145 /DNA_START=1266 /DNA_END=2369 /DNA_ORIENTATION=+ /assembly_acc=CAM_ASM_000155